MAFLKKLIFLPPRVFLCLSWNCLSQPTVPISGSFFAVEHITKLAIFLSISLKSLISLLCLTSNRTAESDPECYYSFMSTSGTGTVQNQLYSLHCFPSPPLPETLSNDRTGAAFRTQLRLTFMLKLSYHIQQHFLNFKKKKKLMKFNDWFARA